MLLWLALQLAEIQTIKIISHYQMECNSKEINVSEKVEQYFSKISIDFY